MSALCLNLIVAWSIGMRRMRVWACPVMIEQDDGKAARDLPILSLSLGQSATFRIGGGTAAADPMRNLRLHSGDVVSFGGPRRLALHGIGRLLKLKAPERHGGGTDMDPLSPGGRLNLILRRVRPV